ncbi:leucine-rich repeat-containing protein 15-like [Argonauta hians]
MKFFTIFLLFSTRLFHSTIGETASECPSICRCTPDNSRVAWCVEPPGNFTNFTSTLTELHLTGIHLGPTFSHDFPPMPELNLLDLSSNGIYLLGSNILRNLPNLKTLILSDNRLSTLAPQFFQNNGKLEILDLSRNKFSAMPDHCMKYLAALRVFNISYNILTSPSLMLGFQQTKNLEVMDYSGNQFPDISSDIFLFAEQWNNGLKRHVNLTKCNMKAINPEIFRNFPGLSSLSLSGNPLISRENLTLLLGNIQNFRSLSKLDLSNMNHPLITSSFASLEQIVITELDISGNDIELISAIDLQYLSTLRTIKLGRNHLKTLGGLVRLSNLRYLDISRNHLNKLHIDYVRVFSKLEHFIAHHNNLNSVMSEQLLEWKMLSDLDISHNNLEMFSLPMMPKLKNLRISHNKLRSLLFPVEEIVLQTIDASHNKLTSLVPFQFSGMKDIESVNYSNNDITMIHEQTFKGYTPRKIDLSGNKITKLGHYGWEFAMEVYFRKNLVKEIDKQAFYHMFSLEILDLGGNNIEIIQPGTFQHLQNLTTLLLSGNSFGSNTDFGNIFDPLFQLKHLDLSGNALTALSNASLKKNPHLKSLSLTFNNLTRISPKMFSTTVELERIDFSLNPYLCDCDLLPLRDWLRHTPAQLHNVHLKRAYACKNPPERNGIDIRDFEVDHFECHKNLLYLIIFGSITLCLVMVIAFLLVVRRIHERCEQRRISKNFKMLNRGTVDWAQSKDQINPLLIETLKKKLAAVTREEPSKTKTMEKLQDNTNIGTAETVGVKKESEKENIYVNCQEIQEMKQRLKAKYSRRSATPDPFPETKPNRNISGQRRHSFSGNNDEYQQDCQRLYFGRPLEIRNDRGGGVPQWRNQIQNQYRSVSSYHLHPKYGYGSVPGRYRNIPDRYGSVPDRYGSVPERYKAVPERYPNYVDSWPYRYSRNVSDSVLVHRPHPYPPYSGSNGHQSNNRHLVRNQRRGGSVRLVRRGSVAQWL